MHAFVVCFVVLGFEMTYNVFSGTLNPTHFTSRCVRFSFFQEIGLGEHLQNDLFCVEWDVKP